MNNRLTVLVCLDTCDDEFACVLWSASSDQFELFSTQGVIGNEKMLKFFQEIPIYIAERADVLVVVGVGGHRDEAIVAPALAPLDLLRFDHSNQPRRHD